ncbi:MAG: chalcone isomerase family protein [Candidatus Thiodiazotropha sp.]|jgi:hypothetical protein
MIKMVLASLLLLTVVQSVAKEIAGLSVSDQILRETDHAELLLNGAGVRKKFFFKVYLASLYLEQRIDNASSVVTLDRPARVEMRVIYSEIEKEKFVQGWNEGFAANLTQQEMDQVRERLNAFNGLFETLQEGDVILLDYYPAKGTQVRIKGVDKGLIAGADFFQALLKVWLGEAPVSQDLKEALLGQ